MPGESFRVALVGCGAISEMFYMPALLALEQAREMTICAVMDPAHTRMTIIGQHFPAAARARDLAGIMETRPDLVIVASPPRFHAEQSVALLGMGTPVLCEKPMANTEKETREMILAAEKSGTLLAVGLCRRFFPALKAIKELILTGALGEAREFSFSEGGKFSWPAQSASFFEKSSSRGGVLLDVGAHVLDIVGWWFGTPVDMRYEDDAAGGLEANCCVYFDYGSFAGSVRLSRDTSLSNRYFVRFEKGWVAWNAMETNRFEIQWDGHGSSLSASAHQPRPNPRHMPLQRSDCDFYSCFINQIRNVKEAILGSAPLEVPGIVGAESLRLIERCYSIRKPMEMGWFTDAEQQGVRRFEQGRSA